MSSSGTVKPSLCSAIVANVIKGHHILKIDGYSRTKGTPTGEHIKSCQFTVCGHRWRIKYYPNGDQLFTSDYISLFLMLDEDVTSNVRAQFKICFAGGLAKKQPSLASEPVRNFPGQREWGYSRFVKREDLERSAHLKHNSFAVRCDIEVISVRAKEAVAEAPKLVSVPPSDLGQHLGDLLETKKGADVVFEVDGETFAAHRCVLAARSLVFSAELYGSMKESNDAAGVVRVEDVEAQVFRALLYFAYTDALPAMQKDDEVAMCQHLLVAADRYGMERLKLICEEMLCGHIDVQSVASILALADQHHCHGLKKACFLFLSSPANMKAAVDTEGFQHLSRSCPSIMVELFAMSTRTP